VQKEYGAAVSAEAVERFLSDAARAAVAQGVTRLVAAGGETSGAVVQALDVAQMEIGPEIAAGVPALAIPGRDLTLALKSRNFGQPDFFARALRTLERA
jgi:3-dehydrotetronate 4-kinase